MPRHPAALLAMRALSKMAQTQKAHTHLSPVQVAYPCCPISSLKSPIMIVSGPTGISLRGDVLFVPLKRGHIFRESTGGRPDAAPGKSNADTLESAQYVAYLRAVNITVTSKDERVREKCTQSK